MPAMRPIPVRARAAPKKAQPTSRLAMLRAHADLMDHETTRRGANWLASAAVYLGVAVAGAVWIGGSLFDFGRAAGALADQTATASGFGAAIEVRGVSESREAEIRAQAMAPGLASMWAADPQTVRARLKALAWVEDAVVLRRWPDSLIVNIRPKASFVAAQAGAAL